MASSSPSRSGMSRSFRRLLIEIGIVTGVALAGLGAWWWADLRGDRALADAQRRAEARQAELETAAETWAARLAAREAEAAFRGYAAGLYPQLLERARGAGTSGGPEDDLEAAIGALLELPGVTFVHVLEPDGMVLASSDRKLQVAGVVGSGAAGDAAPTAVDGRADWALGTTELASRAGLTEGTVEIASPILGRVGPPEAGPTPIAVLWVGYATGQGRDLTRPEALDDRDEAAPEDEGASATGGP